MIGKARRWLASVFLLALLAFLLMPMRAEAQTRPAPPPVRHATVTHVSAYAVPNYYVGHSRAVVIRVIARADIRDNHHTWTRLVYRWQRSDGSLTPYRVIFVAPGQRQVTLEDPLYIRYGTHRGYNWDQLQIAAPNRINSNLAFFFIRWTRP